MITCEQFEGSFRAWKEGGLGTGEEEEMRRHASACAFCASYDGDTARLKVLLNRISLRDVSPGFDLRLQRRIREAAGERLNKKRAPDKVLPRWAAWGAGLATGVVIGVALLMPSGSLDNSRSQLAENEVIPVEHSDQAVIAPADSASDSTTVPQDLYRMDEHSQTVSTDH